jgi:hypothetical protein
MLWTSSAVSVLISEHAEAGSHNHATNKQSCAERMKQMAASKASGNALMRKDSSSQGSLTHMRHLDDDSSCDVKFAEQAKVVQGYMSNASNRVLLFGWVDCPCTGIAQSRFSEKSVCYESLTWLYPTSKLMAYLQCKEKRNDIHSFVYFRSTGEEWNMLGSGFDMDARALKEDALQEKLTGAKAATSCKQANIKVNLYGTRLEACQTEHGDRAGSWADDGTCSEQVRGVHEICIEGLPADFSTATHQPDWSRQREGRRHCVCIGAWSLYMTDSQKHIAGADKIMPHCKSIPETALTKRYLQQWGNWNGYEANVALSAKQLVHKCMQAPGLTDVEKCGLKARYLAFRNDVPELNIAEKVEIDLTMENMVCN